jgi:hypothetical protein
LFLALALNVFMPIGYFLGIDRPAQIAGSCLLVFAPIFFAGVIFAASFQRSDQPDRDFAANIAGAVAGGLAEYASMLLGFHYLMLLAIGIYALSAVFGRGMQSERKEVAAELQGAASG